MNKFKGKVVYIAGPITNDLSHYKVKFEMARIYLTALGAIVLDPSFLPEGLKSHEAYMRITLPMLAEADCIICLPNWEESKGTRMEIVLAHELKLPMYEFLTSSEAPRYIQGIVPLTTYQAIESPVIAADAMSLHVVIAKTKELWSKLL